ncbi:MAG: YcxB family protein [Terracidiphilus sp.]
MKFEFTVTLEDYKAALRLHRSRKLSRRIFLWIGPSLFLISLILFVAGSFRNNTAILTQAIVLAAWSLLVTIAFPLLRLVMTRRGYKQMFPPTRFGRTSTIEIDDQRIVEENPGTEEVRLPWTGVMGFAQNDRVTLIYINANRFFLFPTSVLSPAQHAELNDLVARHVVKR